jgi:hypothetical protein
MKGKNLLIGTAFYLVALFAVYGTKTVTYATDEAIVEANRS